MGARKQSTRSPDAPTAAALAPEARRLLTAPVPRVQRKLGGGSPGAWRRRPATTLPVGRLAQLGERLVYTQEVAGSSPAPPTLSAVVDEVLSGGETGRPRPVRSSWPWVGDDPQSTGGGEDDSSLRSCGHGAAATVRV